MLFTNYKKILTKVINAAKAEYYKEKLRRILKAKLANKINNQINKVPDHFKEKIKILILSYCNRS